MHSLIAKEARLSPFCLLDLAVRENYADFLFDCLLEALRDSEVELNIDPSVVEPLLLEESVRYRANLIKRVVALIDNDENGSLIHHYYDLVAASEPDLVKDITPNLLACEIWPLFSHLNLDTINLPEHDSAGGMQIYRANPLIYKSFTKQSLLLAPFYYLVFLPFWPPNESKKIRPLILDHARHMGHESCLISNLTMSLMRSGLRVRVNFLRFILLNDENFIFSDECKIKYTVISNLVSNFKLYAQLIDRKLYSYWEQDYFNPIPDNEDDEPVIEVHKLQFNLIEIQNLLLNRVNPNFINRVDWLEVAAKLLINSYDYNKKIQGLTALLHQYMVELLLTSKKALKKIDFENAIGFNINLEPDTLPPGRIMAYVTHPRFLNTDEAYYVLKDWVETDTEKRGKIPKSRIATPFIEKDIYFSRLDLFRVINSDDLYLKYGIVDVDNLTNHFIHLLPSKPHEPYYVRLIKENINKLLKDEMVYLGLSFYMSRELCPHRHSSDTINSWRLRIAASLFISNRNLDDAINSIDNPEVRKSLERMIR